jgi:hypothetical protein
VLSIINKTDMKKKNPSPPPPSQVDLLMDLVKKIQSEKYSVLI